MSTFLNREDRVFFAIGTTSGRERWLGSWKATAPLASYSTACFGSDWRMNKYLQLCRQLAFYLIVRAAISLHASSYRSGDCVLSKLYKTFMKSTQIPLSDDWRSPYHHTLIHPLRPPPRGLGENMAALLSAAETELPHSAKTCQKYLSSGQLKAPLRFLTLSKTATCRRSSIYFKNNLLPVKSHGEKCSYLSDDLQGYSSVTFSLPMCASCLIFARHDAESCNAILVINSFVDFW